MISNRIKQLIKKVLLSLTLVFVFSTSLYSINTYAGKNISPYQLSKNSIVYQQKETKGKILIYHTHSREDYVDSNVMEMGEDLANKLEKKGYIVEHVKEDFSIDYNTAYDKSRNYLLNIDLDEFDLIIDYHRDSLDFSNTENVKGVNVAKGMIVYDTTSKNYDKAKLIGDEISKNIDKFNDKIARENFYYEGGINQFNSDLDDNIVLWESGNNKNSKLEIKRLNTYFASSIDTCLKR